MASTVKGPKPGDVVKPSEPTLETALSLAAIGWPVFPVRITVLDDDGRTDKKPLVKWLEGATTDAETIRRWWTHGLKTKTPLGRVLVPGDELWVGVHCQRAGLLVGDLDVPKGGDRRDGRAELKRAGLVLPSTFRYATRSGGQHHLYAAPEGVPLTITKNDPVPGVDIRGGNGLFVYYGPALTEAPELAAAPEWMVAAATAKREATSRTSGDVEAFLARCATGKPDREVREALEDVTPQGLDHDAMLACVTRLVRAGRDGRPGVAEALAKAREVYTRDWPEHGRQWDMAVAGSVGTFGLPPATLAIPKAERKALKKKAKAKTPEARAEKAGGDLEVYAAPTAGHRALDDGPLAEEVAALVAGRWAWSETLGLIRYRGHLWQQADEAVLFEHVRRELKRIAKVEVEHAVERADRSHALKVATLAARNRVAAIGRTLVGILAADPVRTDDHADLLNAPNGVVDLRTGKLLPHDPALYFTKTTGVPYDPDAASADWSRALEALPPKVAEWVQVRMGQAMTGHTPDDAVMPLFEGSGSNGKSTQLDAIRKAAGGYAVTVSDRLLLANPGDHPTELTQLMGARLAVAEELPEGRHLNVKRLKDVLGTATLTARQVRRDNVTWRATHAIVVSTNYRPIVAETDHGTWRRLALVTFPFTFVAPGSPLKKATDREGDPNLVVRLGQGDPAVLAWLVEGARRWYAAGRILPKPPKKVARDTSDWREDADPVMSYARDRLEVAEGYAIGAADLASDFATFLESRTMKPWNDQTVAQRFAGHAALPGVERRVVTFGPDVIPSRPPLMMRPMPTTTKAWVGVRFRTPDMTLPPASAEVRESERQRGA